MMDTRYTDADIHALVRDLLAKQLPKAQWTHEAHCAAALCLERDHPDFDVSRDMPEAIRTYNEAVGVQNTDHDGYHETITQFYARVVKSVCRRFEADIPLCQIVAAMMASPFGAKSFPLNYYSKGHLFSVSARRTFVLPDLKDFDFEAIAL